MASWHLLRSSQNEIKLVSFDLMAYELCKIRAHVHLYACYFWRLNKCTINGSRAVNADAGPDMQYAGNVRAALC